MAAIRVLVDIDVLIDYFNAGDHSALLENPRNRIYYSIVKRNDQLLAKRKLALPSAKPSRARCGVPAHPAHPADRRPLLDSARRMPPTISRRIR